MESRKIINGPQAAEGKNQTKRRKGKEEDIDLGDGQFVKPERLLELAKGKFFELLSHAETKRRRLSILIGEATGKHDTETEEEFLWGMVKAAEEDLKAEEARIKRYLDIVRQKENLQIANIDLTEEEKKELRSIKLKKGPKPKLLKNLLKGEGHQEKNDKIPPSVEETADIPDDLTDYAM